MKPATLDFFSKLKYLSAVTFSPSGESACFVVSDADVGKNCYHSNIYSLRGREVRQITSGGKEGGFVFADESTILFPGNREGKEEKSISSKYYEIRLDGGEAKLKLTFPIPVERLIPLKNGDFLAVASTYPGYEDLYKGDKKLAKKYLDEREENEDYEIVTQNPWWWNGTTFTRGEYSTLYYYTASTGKLSPLTPFGQAVSDVKLSGDEKTVYYTLTDVTVSKPYTFGSEVLYRQNLLSRDAEKIAESCDGFNINGYWVCDSFVLICASDVHNGMNTDGDFYKLDLDTLKITPYCKWGYCIGSSVGSDIRHGGGRAAKAEGNKLYFVSTVYDGSYLYCLDDGKIEKVLGQDGSVDCFDVKNGKILAVCLWNMRAQEIYNEKEKKLTSFNDAALKQTYVAVPESLNCVSRGEEIHGFVLKPFGFDPTKKYPVILDVHGGPKTVYGKVFYHEMQYWAGLGYFVIYCNPVGSDGRGDFMDIMGKYGTIDYGDLMNFCDAALAAYPQMDKENFFETGGSYGGFMTNWIIGHTDRFRACASQRSISNWLSFYGVSDIGLDFTVDQNKASPWPDADKLWDRSPMKYADKVKTPTLFIHSFEDYRCPIDQGYQMFSSLVDHGVETKMVLFKGENHELSRSGKPKHRIKRLDEITKWFEKHKI